MKTNAWIAILGLVFLPGCATYEALYSWGPYEESSIVISQSPDKKGEAVENLLVFIQESESNGEALPPGIYAEVGTLMYELGNITRAIEYYKMEYKLWPESRPMLGALSQNLEARQ